MAVNKLIRACRNGTLYFARAEEGAQVVEYALIIAMVSIALIIALSALAGPENPFENMITKFNDLLGGLITT